MRERFDRKRDIPPLLFGAQCRESRGRKNWPELRCAPSCACQPVPETLRRLRICVDPAVVLRRSEPPLARFLWRYRGRHSWFRAHRGLRATAERPDSSRVQDGRVHSAFTLDRKSNRALGDRSSRHRRRRGTQRPAPCSSPPQSASSATYSSGKPTFRATDCSAAAYSGSASVLSGGLGKLKQRAGSALPS